MSFLSRILQKSKKPKIIGWVNPRIVAINSRKWVAEPNYIYICLIFNVFEEIVDCDISNFSLIIDTNTVIESVGIIPYLDPHWIPGPGAVIPSLFVTESIEYRYENSKPPFGYGILFLAPQDIDGDIQIQYRDEIQLIRRIEEGKPFTKLKNTEPKIVLTKPTTIKPRLQFSERIEVFNETFYRPISSEELDVRSLYITDSFVVYTIHIPFSKIENSTSFESPKTRAILSNHLEVKPLGFIYSFSLSSNQKRTPALIDDAGFFYKDKKLTIKILPGGTATYMPDYVGPESAYWKSHMQISIAFEKAHFDLLKFIIIDTLKFDVTDNARGFIRWKK